MPKYYLKDKSRFAIPVVDTLDNFIAISDSEYSALIKGVEQGNRIECIDNTLVLVPNEIPDNSSTEYKILRAREYPPITDYIDGVVKGDQQQIENYIARCLEIKAKYPKPE